MTKKDLNIQANIEVVKKRIEDACRGVGRDPKEVTLLPVSKTKTALTIRNAISNTGLSRFGENRVHEAMHKAKELIDLNVRWCIIGHLQTNKVKHVVKFATEVHSLDRLKLAQVLDKRLQKEGKSLDVLVQINSSNEPQKYGVDPKDALSFVKELTAFSSLKVKGLMTLALFSSDEKRVRSCFSRMRNLRDRLRQEAPSKLSWDVLSMGMSGDFEIAIEEGATEVRVGQAIFGVRHLPDSYYWPA